MTMTSVKPNVNNFSEVTLNDKQPLVTNNLGRAIEQYELVHLDGYFGELREYDELAAAATGRINIDHNRTIRTKQVLATTTFVAGQPVYFTPGGSSAAGKITAVPVATSIKVGICLDEEGTGGAQTSVTFRPFAQGGEAEIGEVLKVKEIVVPIGSLTAPVVNTDIPVGSKIIAIKATATATVASATATVSDGTNDITKTAVTMAVIDVVTEATDIDQTYKTVVAAGVTITANGDTDQGVVHIYYI